MMNSKICELLDIEFPLVAFTHCRDVVVAVSKAGGCGVLGAVGMSPEQLEKEHDKVLSLTSHLPHLISYSLVLTAMKKETSLNSKLVKFSAGGFRDFTRVAGSDPEMWRDIFLANSSQIQKLTSNFISELKEFSRNLNKSNSHNLLTKLKKTKNVRDKIVKARQAGKFIPND